MPKTIDIYPHEIHRLAEALAEDAADLANEATNEPLRSQDPNTRRYVMLDEAYGISQRSHELREYARRQALGRPA